MFSRFLIPHAIHRFFLVAERPAVLRRLPEALGSLRLKIAAVLVAGCALLPLASSLAQDTNNSNPSGPSGDFNGDVTTAGCYDPLTQNAKRTVTDLVVPGSNGAYPLAFTRTYNSQFVLVASDPSYFGDGSNWRHSYQWTVSLTNVAYDGSASAYTVAYPDGRVVTFRSGRGSAPAQEYSTYWRGPAGNTDRLEVQSASNINLHMADGGIVVFGGVAHPSTIIDPHGATTVLTYDNPANPQYLTQVTEPGGRYLRFTYNTTTVQVTRSNGTHTKLVYTWLGQITASTGQYVTYSPQVYSYQSSAAETGVTSQTPYLVLTTVVYHNETSTAGGPVYASYGYHADPSYTYVPLLTSALDPHYAGAMTGISYVYSDNSGDILAEKNFNTGENVSLFDHGNMIETRGDRTGNGQAGGVGISRSFHYGEASTNGFATTNASASLLTTVTDFQGNPSYTAYFGHDYASIYGQGYVAYVKDRVGNQTSYQHEPLTGKTTWMQMPDGCTRSWQWLGMDGINTKLPYYLFQTTDERGQTTHYRRASNTGLLQEVDYPDGGYESFGYVNCAYNGGTAFYKVSLHVDQRGAYTYYNYDEPNHGGSGHTGLVTSVKRIYTDWQNNTHTEVTQLYYDTFDRLNQSTDQRGVTEQFTYDACHRLTKNTHPADNTWVGYTYDDYGNCTAVTDELGHTTTRAYDEYRRPTSVVQPVNAYGFTTRTTTFSYERRDVNNTQVLSDALSHTSRGVGTTILASNRAGYTVYNANGTVFANYTGMTWDGSQLHPADGYSFTYCTRDADDRVIASYDAHGYATQTAFDNCGRVSSVTDPNGHVASYAYYPAPNAYPPPVSNAGLLYTVTTPGNDSSLQPRVTTYQNYDAMGRLKKVQDPLTHVFNTTYNAAGDVSTQTDGVASHQISYPVDQLGRKSTVTFPDGSFEAWIYDASGNVSTYRNRKGNTQTFSYDMRNHLQGYTWDDNPQTIGASVTIDPAGRLTYASNGYATQNLAYDDSGGLKKDTQYVDGGGNLPPFKYTRDADGLVTQVTDPDQETAGLTYNARDQITASTVVIPPYPNNTYGLASYTYDVDWLLQRYLQNGGYTGYRHQPNGRIDISEHRNLGASHQNISRRYYGYLPNGQMSWMTKMPDPGNPSVTEDGSGDAYVYYADNTISNAYHEAYGMYSGDNSNQDGNIQTNAQGDSLPRGASNPQRSAAFAYDPAGNWTSLTYNGSVLSLGTASSTNGYAGFGYDTGGNTTYANGVTFQYDAFGHMLGASTSTNSAIFRYDIQGRCCVRNINGVLTYFYYVGDRVMEERNASGQRTTSYVYGPEGQTVCRLDANWGAIYYHYDARGYVTHLTDAGCNVIEQYLYDAFGTPFVYDGTGTVYRGQTSAYGNRQMFCGSSGYEWYPEFGIYHAGARDYVAALGRWLQPDPIGQEGGLNVYAYCGNDPINGSDPSGLFTLFGIPVFQSTGSGPSDGEITNFNDTSQSTGGYISDGNRILVGPPAPAANPNNAVLTTTTDVGEVFRQFSINYGQATRTLETGTKILSYAVVSAVGVGAIGAAVEPVSAFVAGSPATAAGVAGAVTAAASNPTVQQEAEEAAELLEGPAAEEGSTLATKCFPLGTQVATPRGDVNIEDIKVGDKIYACDLETGKIQERNIIGLIHNCTYHWIDVQVGPEVIRATRSHPFWVESEKQWIEAAYLKKGMMVRLESGATMSITNISTFDLHQPQLTYNLEVDVNHDYFVGHSHVLVHNGDGSYTLTFASGKQYVGKGDLSRAADSAARITKQTGDSLVSTRWTPANGTTDSFVQEEMRMRSAGGPGGNTYNQIKSPGNNIAAANGCP